MAAARPIVKHVFVLAPQNSSVGLASEILREPLRVAMSTCRVAYEKGLTPLCPLLMYSSYLSAAEYMMDAKHLCQRWIQRADRIWLQFPDDDEKLDSVSYDLLDANERKARTNKRKPVYKLKLISDEMVPVVMTRDAIKDLLMVNITAVTANQCI